ncbi:MAG TPA: hypothetical protein VIF62_30230 [Labilithrix sp.]
MRVRHFGVAAGVAFVLVVMACSSNGDLCPGQLTCSNGVCCPNDEPYACNGKCWSSPVGCAGSSYVTCGGGGSSTPPTTCGPGTVMQNGVCVVAGSSSSSSGGGGGCPERAGETLCGFCSSQNQCAYCPNGQACSSNDACTTRCGGGGGSSSGGCTAQVCCGGLFECNGRCYATCTPGSQPCCSNTNCTCYTPCC